MARGRSTGGGERRRLPRSQARLAVVELRGNQRVPRTASRFGVGGFFLELPVAEVVVGQLVVVEFAAPDGPLRVTGEVVYVSDAGAGVRMTRVDWRRLQALLDRLGPT